MKNIIPILCNVLASGRRCVLCFITQVSGSTPRGIGTSMLVTEDELFGTVGGGQAEFDAIILARQMLQDHKAFFVNSFQCLSKEELNRMNESYGGKVTIWFTQWDESNLALAVFLRNSLRNESSGFISFSVSDCKWSASYCLIQSSPSDFYYPVTELKRCFVFGAGHVSQALVPLLSSIDYSCYILDERADLLNKDHFPTASGFYSGSIVSSALQIHFNQNDSTIILTRGYQGDYDLLKLLLHTPVWYLGLVGSHKKMEATFANLIADGFSLDDCKRIVSPIGLPIHAETPSEIAISIAAQMIDSHFNVGRKDSMYD